MNETLKSWEDESSEDSSAQVEPTPGVVSTGASEAETASEAPRESTEVLSLWIEELRSGNYRQGRMSLISMAGTRHCCLGVFCEVMGFPRVVQTGIPGYDIYGVFHDLAIGADQIHEAFPHLNSDECDTIETLLTQANDHSIPFSEIADFLEALGDEHLQAAEAYLEEVRGLSPHSAFRYIQRKLGIGGNS